MLTIKDISASKELDSKAMTEVRGGDAAVLSTNYQSLNQLNVGPSLVNVNSANQGLFSSNNAIDNDVEIEKITNVAAGFGNFAIAGQGH